MSLFEHDDNAIGQTEAISNIYATVSPSHSIPPRPTTVLLVMMLRPDGSESSDYHGLSVSYRVTRSQPVGS